MLFLAVDLVSVDSVVVIGLLIVILAITVSPTIRWSYVDILAPHHQMYLIIISFCFCADV